VIYWIDAQLPPQLAKWLNLTFNVEAYALRDLNLRDAEDEHIFFKARQQGIVIIAKTATSSKWCCVWGYLHNYFGLLAAMSLTVAYKAC